MIRTVGRERGDPNAGVLPDKEVSRNANEEGQCPWMRRASACKRGYIGFNGGGSDTSRVPHGEPYAGKLHVRFNEGYSPKNGEARFEGSRRPSGRSPRGVPLYSTPF